MQENVSVTYAWFISKIPALGKLFLCVNSAKPCYRPKIIPSGSIVPSVPRKSERFFKYTIAL